MNEELEPCECGNKPEVFTYYSSHRFHMVRCIQCGIYFVGKDKKEAIKAWNRRV